MRSNKLIYKNVKKIFNIFLSQRNIESISRTAEDHFRSLEGKLIITKWDKNKLIRIIELIK